MQARVTLPCLSDPRDAEGGFADGCLEPVALLQEKVNEIRPGQTTEEDLVRTFGSPTTRTVDPNGEKSLNWFSSSPISAQNYIPIIGPALNGMQVKAWELWVVVGLNGEVKRYIAYGHYVNGEVKRYIEYGHYPH